MTRFGLLTYPASVIQDTHVPRVGRDLIRQTLEDANVPASVRTSSIVSINIYLNAAAV